RHAEGDAPARGRARRAGDEPPAALARLPAASTAESAQGHAAGGYGLSVRAAEGHGRGSDARRGRQGVAFGGAGPAAPDGNGRGAAAADERRGETAAAGEAEEGAAEQEEEPSSVSAGFLTFLPARECDGRAEQRNRCERISPGDGLAARGRRLVFRPARRRLLVVGDQLRHRIVRLARKATLPFPDGRHRAAQAAYLERMELLDRGLR